MPNRLINKRDVPRGNYDYFVGKTGQTFYSHVFDLLVVKVREHMAANGVDIPPDLAILIEEDYCHRHPEYCRDNSARRVEGEEALTQVAAALAIPAANALHVVGKALGINCEACNMRHRIIRRIKQLGVSETIRQLKGTF